MPIYKSRISDTAVGVQRAPIRHLKLADFDRMFGVRDDANIEDVKAISEDFWKWTEEVREALEASSRKVDLATRLVWEEIDVEFYLLLESEDMVLLESGHRLILD